MLLLRTLGGLTIDNGGRAITGAAGQRGRLAILAAIGVRETGISRDRLLALFWPESDTRRASGALRQALYSLRRDLSEQELTLGTSVLRLNARVITSDVADFRNAIAASDLERAAAHYVGPFLDGIHARDDPDFERWIELERASLESEYRKVVERLVTHYRSKGDHRRVVESCRRIVGLDVLSETATSGLLDALVAAGDFNAALQHARVYEKLVAQELGTAPSSALAQRINSIKRQAGTPKAFVIVAGESREDTAGSGPEHTRQPNAGRFDNPKRMAVIVAAVAATVTAGLFALSLSASTQSVTTSLSADSRPLVVAFTGAQNAADSALATIVTSLTRSTLETIGLRGNVRAIPIIRGSVTQTDDKALVTASLFADADAAAPLSQTIVESDRASIDLLAVRAIARLIGPLIGPGVSDIAAAAAATAGSAESLTEFLAGENNYRAARFGAAADAFQRAVSHDSLFALGWYRLSTACDWAGRDRCINEADSHAVALRSRVGEHYELLIQGLHAWHRGDGETAERAYGYVTGSYPGDPESWYQLADARFHLGPLRGVPIEESRDAFERSLALDPRNRDAMIHLARLAVIRRDPQVADSLFSHAIALSTESEAKELRLTRMFASHDAAAFERFVTTVAPRETDDFLRLLALRLVMFGGRREEARRLTSILASPSRPAGTRVAARVRLAELSMIEGHIDLAEAELRKAEVLAHGTRAAAYAAQRRQFLSEFVYFMDGLGSAVPSARTAEEGTITDPNASFPRTSQNDLRDFADRYVGSDPAMVAKLIGGIQATRTRDALVAASANRALARWPDKSKSDSARSFATFLAAVRAFRDGRYETAAAEFEPQPWGPLWYAAKPAARYLHAMALERLGRTEEALRWYATFWDVATEEQVFAAPARYRRGRILEQRRDFAGAAAEYREVGALWTSPDAPLRVLTQDAEARVFRLSRVTHR